jgi:hypothetical protein
MTLVCYLDIVHHVGFFKHNILQTGPVFVIPYSGKKASCLVVPDNKTENGPLCYTGFRIYSGILYFQKSYIFYGTRMDEM